MADTDPKTPEWDALKDAYSTAETAETEASDKLVAAQTELKEAEQAVADASAEYATASERKLSLATSLENYRIIHKEIGSA